MCGIAGYISLNKSIEQDQFKRANSLLQHRGPDAEGYYFSPDNKTGLAHRRLSIIDLSTSANQPMFSADGRYCIVFNGEIYNYKELRLRLHDRGASLKTTGDTEVLLELFAQQGIQSFSLLNGMFAFAIFDAHTQILTLCRDHVGIKPLFYYKDDNTIMFTSELKVIHAFFNKKLSVNKQAIPYFLHLGFIPQPLTIYNDTFKFPSGSYWQIDTNQSSLKNTQNDITSFWTPQTKIGTHPLSNEPEAKKQLETLLIDAIQKQMVSDVPIGTFLSGGVDSSLVTAIASKLTPNKINTFSIAIDSGKYNESAFAGEVAKKLNTAHHEFEVKEKEVMELVDKLLPAYDEPFADASAFPTMMVSRLTKQQVTVALSGDGGDELFLGYGMYKWAKRLANPSMRLVKEPIFYTSKLLSSRYQRIGNMFAYGDKGNIMTHIFSQEQYYFMERELNLLLVEPGYDFSGINQSPAAGRLLSAAEKQSLWDFDHYLKDDLLVKVDRASMQYSLETRVPLLDYRLVEFAFNLDEQLKIKNGTTKYLLKQVLYDYLPKAIFDRPKWGFGIPLNKWLKTDLKYLLDKYTSETVITKYNLVHFSMVKEMKLQYLSGIDYLFARLWLVIILHWWLEENSLAKNISS
jgi:asparagine synthase (glutamine-hydrolysing)